MALPADVVLKQLVEVWDKLASVAFAVRSVTLKTPPNRLTIEGRSADGDQRNRLTEMSGKVSHFMALEAQFTVPARQQHTLVFASVRIVAGDAVYDLVCARINGPLTHRMGELPLSFVT